MIRSVTLSEKQIEKLPPISVIEWDLKDLKAMKPRNRADCERIPRPCPFVSCRYHLYCDINQKGSLKLNFPDLEPWDLIVSCALDVADLGGCTLQEIGDVLNITRERVRQVQDMAMKKLNRKYRIQFLFQEVLK